MSDTTFEVGQVIQSGKLRLLPPGSKVVHTGTLEVKTRAGDGQWFEEGGTGYSGSWIVAKVAPRPEPKPDLSNRDVLAQELFRKRNNTPKPLDPLWREGYERVANFVLANFIALPAHVRDGEYDDWYLSEDGKYSQYKGRKEGAETLHEIAETYGGYTVQ